jgi:hypothetical protein
MGRTHFNYDRTYQFLTSSFIYLTYACNIKDHQDLVFIIYFVFENWATRLIDFKTDFPLFQHLSTNLTDFSTQ